MPNWSAPLITSVPPTPYTTAVISPVSRVTAIMNTDPYMSLLFGRPREESQVFAANAFKVREIGVSRDMYGSVFMIAVTLLTGLFTAVVYGVGGTLVIRGALQFGTLVALAQLLTRVYGPIGSLSNVQVQVMTALVSFDRVFEVLDLEPLIKEKPDAVTLPRDDARHR